MPELDSAFDAVELRDATKVAALDIGSNSFHLVVARIVAGSVQILHRVKQKVRLADGLEPDKMLSQDAIDRGLDTLRVIAESLKGFEPDSVRIVATYTLRKARNANVFIEAASQVIPYPIEVISGTEEARLIYSGVAHTSQDEGRRLVVDIGGGSTEFIIGEGYTELLTRSLQMGCVSFTKRFFKSGELKAKAFDKAIMAAQQELELIDDKYKKLSWLTCTGTSGTIKNIAILAKNLSDEQHDTRLTLTHLELLIAKCCEAGHTNAMRFEGMTEDRRPVFPAGLAILTAVFRSLDIEWMEYSSAALREGVIYEMEENLTHPDDVRERTAQSLATRYDVDTQHAKRVLATAMKLFEACAKTWKINGEEYEHALGWSALLHEVGLQINSRGVQKHSGYILENVDMPGFNQEQQILLATLARLHRKKIRNLELPVFTQFKPERVSKLLALLRLSVLLNIKRQDDFLPDFDITAGKNSLSLQFPNDWLASKPILFADLERETVQLKTLNIELSII